MEAAKAKALSEDVREIVLCTWAFNEQAQAFFDGAGFRPFSIGMRHRPHPVPACDPDA